jgi:hypothetical protein
MLQRKRTKAELKYIASVFLRTGIIAGAWFGITGLALNALSDRASLQCDRNEESVPECKLSTKYLLTETAIKIPIGELRQVTSQAVASSYLPSLVQWQMAIETNHGGIALHSDGLASSNYWESFTTRTNRFLDTPQMRSFTITAEYSFWFKFLSQSVSGVSILFGLFIIPGLYLTAKYGDDATAHQQAFDRLFGQFSNVKPNPATSDDPKAQLLVPSEVKVRSK